MKYDVFGIGDALMDILIEVEHSKLLELNLKCGQFHLVDEENSKKILKNIEKNDVKTSPGGSSANTIHGVAMLGGNAVFCGKVGKDKHGDMYEEKMAQSRVKTNIRRCDKSATGHAITFITPDCERTFAVCLGASLNLTKEDIIFEDIKNSRILHIEGYQLEDENLREVLLHAMEFAKKHNVKISIDLGDPGLVSRNKESIRNIIKRYADIVFANEEEAKALTGLEAPEALNEIAKLTEIAIVKIGRGGSFIKKGNKIYNIPCYKANTLDMTGAGDMFAAGVLFGISKNYDLKVCGHIGSFLAAKVVEQIGARLDNINQKEIEELLENIS